MLKKLAVQINNLSKDYWIEFMTNMRKLIHDCIVRSQTSSDFPSVLVYQKIWNYVQSRSAILSNLMPTPLLFWAWLGTIVGFLSILLMQLFKPEANQVITNTLANFGFVSIQIPQLPVYGFTQFMLILGVCLIVVIYTQWFLPLREIAYDYIALTNVNGTDRWLEREIKNVFSLRNVYAIFVIGVVCSLSLYTIYFELNLPYPVWFQVITAPVMFVICCVGGHGVYMATRLYYFLYLLSNLEIDLSKIEKHFLNIPNPAVMKLYNYYIRNFSFVMVFAYIWLLILILSSPFGLAPEFLPFLVVLALYPFPSFLWSYLRTLRMSKKLKQASVNYVNERVRAKSIEINNLSEMDSSRLQEKLEDLNQLIELQEKVENINPSPFRISFVFSGLFTSTTAILQIALTFSDVLTLYSP
ncbi:MAG: hypothetical protein AAF846_23500 [Chloroflexota bacterium]